MIRIVLVDDPAVYRKSLRQVIEQHPDLTVVAEAGDGVAATEAVKEFKPDVVLIDVRLPKMDGLQATKIISSQHPGTKIVVMTLFTDDGTRVKALESGAHHCLAKDSHIQGIIAVIRGCRSPSLQDALYDVLKSRMQLMEEVIISEIPGSMTAFEVKTSLRDHNLILSKIEVIKAAAMKFAGRPEGESFVVNLVVNEESLYQQKS